MIIFGWYSFKIKSFSPEDLSMANEGPQNVAFEVHQKCFHLFWIPFFGIGKTYGLRKDGELYELPQSVVSLIKSNGAIKTPWYTFSLPLVAIMGTLVFFIGEKYNDYKSYQHSKNNYAVALGQLNNELSRLTPNHYLKISNLADYYSYENFYLKVISVEDSLVRCSKVTIKGSSYDIFPFIIREEYLKNKEHLDTLSYPLKQLQQAICQDFDTYLTRQGFGADLFADGNKYHIEAIEYIDGPVIRLSGSASINYGDNGQGKDISLELMNHGAPAALLEIRTMEGSIKWQNALPMHVPTHKQKYTGLQLEGTNFKSNEPYKFMLVFEDPQEKQYYFIVEGKDFEKSITRVLNPSLALSE